MIAGRKFKRKIFAILLTVSMIIMLLPGVSFGNGVLTFLTFVSSSDNNLISGQTSTINFRLWDDQANAQPFSQQVTAHIIDSSGLDKITPTQLTPSTGVYSLNNINLSSGTYTLYVTGGGQTVTGTINVTNSNGSGSGSIHHLSYLTFVSDSDNNLITGVAQNINYRLWDENDQQFSGAVTAYIEDPDGHITSYTATSTSISNVAIDKPGLYTLVITDTNNNSATDRITVGDAKISTSGSLISNYYSTVTVTLKDPDGNPLGRRSITVDATNIGGTSTSYTTLYDGTFTFSMTPSMLGNVNFTLGGHIIGTLQVTPAYTAGTRIGGSSQDNSTLSVVVAQQGWTKADTVILTRDDIVADAMVAAPLSKRYDAPILMTPSDSLSDNVLSEIRTLGAKTVLVIGGTGAISTGITDTLASNGLNVTRFDGTDRYDTAAKIAVWINSPGTVYMAYGYGEPDALAAGALAAEQGIPILLTDTNSLPDSTQNELSALKPKTVVLLGGTGVISSGLEAQLSNAYSVQRWGGVDRYATEQIIFQNFFALKPALDQFPLYITSAYVSPSDVSSGKPFGDALVTAALAAKKNGFVITLPPNTLPNSISTFLLFNKAYIPSGTVVGNSSAISYNLEQLLQMGLTH